MLLSVQLPSVLAKAPVDLARLSDDALMGFAQAGNPAALELLFLRFAARAYRVAHRIVRDDTRAEDAVQDAFLCIWRGRAGYCRQRGTVDAWILGIVRNRSIDSLRRNGRHDVRRANDPIAAERLPAPGNLEDNAGERETAARLHDPLSRLPDTQREALTLAYYGELSATEIARELSIPVGTVKSRIRLALETLRRNETLTASLR